MGLRKVKKSKTRKPRILFVHHTAMWYRRPFFRKLSSLYDVEFVFNNVERYNTTYDTDLSTEIEGLEGVNYTVKRNHLGIAFGAVKKTMENYDIFVGGSWDTLSDVVETLLHFTVLKIKRKPFILWREDWDWNVQSFKRRMVKRLARFLGKNADALLVPGPKHREFFTSLGVSRQKIFIMPNVSNIRVRLGDYKNRDILREKFDTKHKKVVLYVGRLIDLKGVDYLIMAFKKLADKMDNVILLIVGEGECRESLEKLAETLKIGDKVYFTGNIDNELLGGYYLVSDVFVLPSITTYFADACPLVVNEAMSFGRPVVTSDAVGTTFMIEEGKNGYVFPEKDVDALYEAMNKVLSDPELEDKMGLRSKEIIHEGFQYKNMVEGFDRAVDYVMAARR
jgi:glycosyltransferase involved in cell wall biosynthesis